MLRDIGEMRISEANEMNVPVNAFLTEEEDGGYSWVADNFMPRRGRVCSEQYKLESGTKAEIIEAVRRHVVPLYQVALLNLSENGENYYWEKKEEKAAVSRL